MISYKSLPYSIYASHWSKKQKALYSMYCWLIDPNDEWARWQRRQFGYALPKRYIKLIDNVEYIDLKKLVCCERWKQFLLKQNTNIVNQKITGKTIKICIKNALYHTKNKGSHYIKHITVKKNWEIL